MTNDHDHDHDDEAPLMGRMDAVAREVAEAYRREAGEAGTRQGYEAFAKRALEQHPERVREAMTADLFDEIVRELQLREAVKEGGPLPGLTACLKAERAKDPDRFLRYVAAAVWEAGYPWNDPLPKWPLVRRLLRLQDSYVRECGSAGGDLDGFQRRVLLDRKADRSFYRRHATEALAVAKEARLCAAVEAGELVEVDPDDPDESWRTLRVRKEDATANQLREDAVRRAAKVGRLGRKAREGMRLYEELLELAGGDGDAPLAPLMALRERRKKGLDG